MLLYQPFQKLQNPLTFERTTSLLQEYLQGMEINDCSSFMVEQVAYRRSVIKIAISFHGSHSYYTEQFMKKTKTKFK